MPNLNSTQQFVEVVSGTSQVGVSEFARSKAWRSQLSKEGCLEVVERGEPLGVVLSLGYAQVLKNRLLELEKVAEDAVVKEMFKARSSRKEYIQGKKLEKQAQKYFSQNSHELAAAVPAENE